MLWGMNTQHTMFTYMNKTATALGNIWIGDSLQTATILTLTVSIHLDKN